MALVTRKHISEAYNKVIANFIRDGYTISPFTHNSSGSSYRAIYHTDLVSKDNKSIVRVWIVLDYEEFANRHSGYVLSVKAMEYKFNGKFNDKYLSLNDDDSDVLKVISEQKFYRIRSADDDYYVDSYDEMMTIFAKRDSRREARYATHEYGIDNRSIDLKKVPGYVIDFIMDKINQCRGCKRATASCIKSGVFRKSGTYRRDTRFTDLRLYATFDWEFNGKYGRVNMS